MTTILPLYTNSNETVKTNSTSFFADINPIRETTKAFQIEISFVSNHAPIGTSHKFWIPKSACKISQVGVNVSEWFLNKEILPYYNNNL